MTLPPLHPAGMPAFTCSLPIYSFPLIADPRQQDCFGRERVGRDADRPPRLAERGRTVLEPLYGKPSPFDSDMSTGLDTGLILSRDVRPRPYNIRSCADRR